MKKTNLILILLFITNMSMFAQTFDETMIITKISNNLVDIFKNQIGNKNSDNQVIVLPFCDDKGIVTDKSKSLAKKLAAELNHKIREADLDFNVMSYDAQALIEDFVAEHSNLASSEDPEYYKKLWESNNVNYIIVADYYEYNDVLKIENVFVHKNYVIEPPKKSWSPKDVDPFKEVNKIATKKSLMPGMGQFYKKQSAKGSLFLIGSIATLSGGLAAIGAAQYYQSRLNSNPSSTTNRDNKEFSQMVSFGCFAGLGLIYTINLIDAYSSRPKHLKTYALRNINIYPEYCYNEKYLTLKLRF